jgi:hypothetical protein
MDFSILSNNTAVIISGAVLVVIVAYFIFRSMPKKNDKQKHIETKQKKTEKKVSVKSVPSIAVTGGKGSSSSLKTRRNILSKIRSAHKPDIQKDKTEAKKPGVPLKVDKTVIAPPTSPLSEQPVVQSPPDNDVSHITNIEVSNEKVSVEAGTATRAGTSLDSIEMTEAPVENPTNKEENNQAPQLEIPLVQPASQPEKSKSGDDLFSLFTDENQEDNEVSKFAANLDKVDIQDLLTKAREIQKQIRR